MYDRSQRLMEQRVTIREELPSDVEAIAEITAAAFLNHPYSSQTEHFIISGLRRRGVLFLSLVAESEGMVIGHIAFSPVSISDGSRGWYGLGPVSVSPPFQGRGAGKALVNSGLDKLRERGANGCVLLGAPGYYERFGFTASADLVLPGSPPELFLSLQFAGPHPRGEVTYDAAFNAQS